MKHLPKALIFSLFLFLAKISLAQNNSDKINFIKMQYLEINNHLKSYKKIEKEDTVETTEGNEIVTYFDGENIKKITAKYYGETGKESDEYYFSKDQLIFYYVSDEHYEVPMNVDAHIVIASKDEKRYYFYNGSIIKYTHNARKGPWFTDLKKSGEEILKETKRLRSLVR